VPSASNPTDREYVHWLVANIPADNIQKGTTLAPYQPSSPLPDSGIHRYFFILFRQNPAHPVPKEARLSTRSHFRTADFMRRHYLEVVDAKWYKTSYEPVRPPGADIVNT
jgi:phosphatidylethanolamine-binding protein